MNAILEAMVSNIVMACLLAMAAVLAGWWGRRPALTHALWILVILKLVTPPLIQVPLPWPEPAPPDPPALPQVRHLPVPPLVQPAPAVDDLVVPDGPAAPQAPAV